MPQTMIMAVFITKDEDKISQISSTIFTSVYQTAQGQTNDFSFAKKDNNLKRYLNLKPFKAPDSG